MISGAESALDCKRREDLDAAKRMVALLTRSGNGRQGVTGGGQRAVSGGFRWEAGA